MTDHSTATGKPRPPWRAGALALHRLSDPVDARILVALRDRALGLQELRRSVGAPPPTTLRKHLAQLEADQLLSRRRIDVFPGVGEVRLADAGHGLLSVADSLSAWLGRCPDGPSGLGTSTARAAINALGAGWSSLMIRALASAPLSLTQLDRLIAGLNYPSLERRLDSLRVIGLVHRCAERGRATPYAPTDWLREAAVPLLHGVRWERSFPVGDVSRLRPRDIEAVLLLSAPLVHLATRDTGSCRISVVTDDGHRVDTLWVVDQGRVVSGTTCQSGPASVTVTGSVEAWLRGVLDGQTSDLVIEGRPALATAVASSLGSLADRCGRRPASSRALVP